MYMMSLKFLLNRIEELNVIINFHVKLFGFETSFNLPLKIIINVGLTTLKRGKTQKIALLLQDFLTGPSFR